jgi:hypothetical protein
MFAETMTSGVYQEIESEVLLLFWSCPCHDGVKNAPLEGKENKRCSGPLGPGGNLKGQPANRRRECD